MSGRLRSPASQKMEFLNLSLTSKISVQRDSQYDDRLSGGLYVQQSIRGVC